MNRPRCIPKALVVLFVLLLLLAGSLSALFAAQHSIAIDDFEKGLHPRWEEKEFKGRTLYSVAAEGDGHVLRAESSGTASGLVLKHEYDVKDLPVLTWRWKVSNIINRGNERRKEGDDYAARVYVVFPHWLPFRTRSINYIWANRLKQGECVANTYYARAMMCAVQSGGEKAGTWITERRNVYEDFKRLFGEEPPKAGAIAVMTDTDQTGESATAWYDDIRLERR